MPGNVMTFRSCQPHLPIFVILGPKKPLSPCFKPSFYLYFVCYQILGLARPPISLLNAWLGPTPDLPISPISQGQDDHYAQFSTFKFFIRLNSFSLFVTKISFWLKAWAAMSKSNGPMGWPCFSNWKRIVP